MHGVLTAHSRAHRSIPMLGPCCKQVVYGHLDDPENEDIRRGISYLRLRPGTHCTSWPGAICT